MNLQQVAYVVEIYRTQSYTRAAQNLYISQPRLSKAIKDLEAELGFEIFQRTRHGIRGATTRGYAFIKEAQKTLHQFELLTEFQQESSVSLRVATTPISHAQDAFQALCWEHFSNPHLNMELWFSGCYESADRVRTGMSDIGIVTVLDSQYEEWMSTFRTMHLEYRDLCESRFYITMNRDLLPDPPEELYLRDLSRFTYITEKCSRMNDLTFDVYALLDRICPEARVTVSNTDIMYSLLTDPNLRRSFVLDSLLPTRSALEKYHLVSIPAAEKIHTHLGYILPEGEPLSPLGTEYIEMIRENLETEDTAR